MLKQQVFVVISGKKKHGKNFFADKIKALLIKEGISVTETAFATPIKKFCHNTFGIPMQDLESQEGKLKDTHIRWCDINPRIAAKMGKFDHSGKEDRSLIDYTHLSKMSDDFITVRELLQIIGTEVFREGFYGPIWAEAPFLKQHTVPFLSQDGPLVVRDNIPVDVVFITDCRFPNEIDEASKHNSLFVRVVRDDIEDDNDAHISETALDNYGWAPHEVVTASTDDGRLDHYAANILLPRIKGLLYGH